MRVTRGAVNCYAWRGMRQLAEVTNCIPFQAQSIRIDYSRTAISIRTEFSGITMAASGSEHSIGGSFMYITAKQMCFRNLTAFQATHPQSFRGP